MSPRHWPYLSIAADQGSDGFSAQFWLKYAFHGNIDFTADLSHGVWRDTEAVWSSLGLAPFVRLMVIVFNLAHGPWEEGVRWHQLQLAMNEYMDLGSYKTCPMFAHFLPALLRDFGMETSAQCSDADEQVWCRVKEHWAMRRKGARVALCRYAGFVDAAERFDSGFHFILMQVLYLGLQEGFFTTSTLKDAVKCQEDMASACAKDERISVARGSGQIAKQGVQRMHKFEWSQRTPKTLLKKFWLF